MNKNKTIEKAMDLIDENILLDYHDLSRKLYIETNYCPEDYSKFMSFATSGKITLRDYLRNRKLYFAACDLIESDELSILEIAQKYGYSEQASFSRAIKKNYDVTPKQLREKNKSDIFDNRFNPEVYLGNTNRLDSILDFLTDNTDAYLSNRDLDYFNDFIHATENYGFDLSICCLISELSEKLEIDYGTLLYNCFMMMIEAERNREEFLKDIPDKEFYAEIYDVSEDDLDSICLAFDCNYFDVTDHMVELFKNKTMYD